MIFFILFTRHLDIPCFFFLLLVQCREPAQEGLEKKQDKPSQLRVVSLAPSITETLFALGLGEHVVGVTRFCDYPPEALKRTTVGGYLDPDLDALTGLNHESVKKQLDLLEIDYLELKNRNLTDVLDAIDTLGRKFQVTNRSDSLLKNFRQRVQKVEQTAKEYIEIRMRANLPSCPSVVISIGRNMGSNAISDANIAGPKTFYTQLLQMAGGKNAYDGKMDYPRVSTEGLIRMNPEMIFDMVPDLSQKRIKKDIYDYYNYGSSQMSLFLMRITVSYLDLG